jgi:phospholipid/cholesterol/gamma-HCH transport system substrate-binding protein
MKAKLTKEAAIGIVTVISLTLLYMGFNYLKGINLFKSVNYYYVECANVKDVVVSSPVFVEGFKVGLVSSISYDYATTNRITLEIHLDKGMRLNRGSYISLEKTLLSGSELHIHLNTVVDDYLAPGSTLEGRSAVDMMGAVQNELLPQLAAILPRLDSILCGLQALATSPALAHSLDHIEQTTASLDVSSRHLARLLEHDVPAITGNLRTASGNFALLSENMMQLDLARSVDQLNVTLTSLSHTAARLNATDSSLGLLLNDTTLYNTLNQTVSNASDLIVDFQQHPRKYIHFSVF